MLTSVAVIQGNKDQKHTVELTNHTVFIRIYVGLNLAKGRRCGSHLISQRASANAAGQQEDKITTAISDQGVLFPLWEEHTTHSTSLKTPSTEMSTQMIGGT